MLVRLIIGRFFFSLIIIIISFFFLSIISIHSCPYSDCKSLGNQFHAWEKNKADSTIFEQKRNIARKGKINRSFLRGFRLPFLDSKGSQHNQALKKYAFNYDSSIVINIDDIKKDGFRYWPHTLDYPVPYKCESCPNHKTLCDYKNCSMESFWIVPMHFMNAEHAGKFHHSIRYKTIFLNYMFNISL